MALLTTERQKVISLINEKKLVYVAVAIKRRFSGVVELIIILDAPARRAQELDRI